jgi:hypothetical protein
MDLEADNIEGWSDGESSGGEGKGSGNRGDRVSLFMKMTERKDPYRVRLVLRITKVRKHFDAFKPLGKIVISPAFNKDTEKDLDVAWSKGNFYPREKYVFLVIDRENPNGLRLLEVGNQLYKVWKNFAEKAKIDPVSADKAPDWIISCERGDNGQIGYSTFPNPTGPSPLTDEEKKMIDEFKFSKEELAEKYFKKATSEEIRELWDSLPDDKKYAPKRKKDDDREDGKKPSQPSAKAPAEAPKKAPAKTEVKDDGFLKSPPAAAPAVKAPAPAAPAEADDDDQAAGDEESASLF